MMNRTTSQDGTAISFERVGHGPPVVLVSGAMCDHHAEQPVADLLADSFTVFTYDRRGRGTSGDTLPYAVAREVEDLAAVIDEADGPVGLYGMSSGGALVVEATAAGLPVTRVAVYEPPFRVDADALSAAADYTVRLREALDRGSRSDAVALFLGLVGTPAEVVEGMQSAPMWPGMEAIGHTLAYDDAVMAGSAVPVTRLAQVHVPLLALDGGASPAFLQQAAREVAEAASEGWHRSLAGQTHAVDPQVLAEVLGEFFAGAG